MIPWLSGLIGVYALTAIGGGIAGYLAKGSMMSLMAGVLSGVILLVGLFLVKKNATLGYGITAFGCVLMIGGMMPRYLEKYTLWPAGVMAIGGIVVLIAHIVAHFMARKEYIVAHFTARKR